MLVRVTNGVTLTVRRPRVPATPQCSPTVKSAGVVYEF